jgi:uncharacterized membrane protein YwzB
MLKFYCLLTGDDYNLLKNDTPQSKKKVKILAFCIMIPVLFWAINSFLLSSIVLKKDYMTSIKVLIICTTIIFIIEKIIVMSNGSRYIALFRICLSIIISLIGSLSLEEVVFQNDIDTQMFNNRRIDTESKLNIKKNQMSLDLMKLEQEVLYKDSIWKAAMNATIGEAEGTTGSKIPNRGPITSLKLQNSDMLKADLETSKTQLSNMKLSNDSILNITEANMINEYNMISLLLRIKDLFDIVKKDTVMLFFYLLFTGLIFLMESVVLIIKMSSNETNYERKIRMQELISEKRMNKMQENIIPKYDFMLFKGEMQKGKSIINKPMNGMFR